MTNRAELLRQARAKLEAGDPRAAAALLVEASGIDAEPETLELLGRCHLDSGQADQAVVPLAAAVGLTDHSRPASLLAKALFDTGRKDEALLIAQRILRRDPRNRDAMAVMQSFNQSK